MRKCIIWHQPHPKSLSNSHYAQTMLSFCPASGLFSLAAPSFGEMSPFDSPAVPLLTFRIWFKYDFLGYAFSDRTVYFTPPPYLLS